MVHIVAIHRIKVFNEDAFMHKPNGVYPSSQERRLEELGRIEGSRTLQRVCPRQPGNDRKS